MTRVAVGPLMLGLTAEGETAGEETKMGVGVVLDEKPRREDIKVGSPPLSPTVLLGGLGKVEKDVEAGSDGEGFPRGAEVVLGGEPGGTCIAEVVGGGGAGDGTGGGCPMSVSTTRI